MVASITEDATDIRIRIRHRNPIMMDGSGMTGEEFYEFCQNNSELRIEREANGKIIIIPPTGSLTGNYNSEISADLVIWNRKHKLGKTFDSSTGFKLPNGAERSPDAAWISNDRCDALPESEKRKFAPIVPDFVLELRSNDQSLTGLQEKMGEYMESGCRLGWLVDPQNRRTYVYAENGDIQTVPFNKALLGGNVLPGLMVKMSEVLV